MWRDRRKIEIALKLLTNFLTTAYRAAMRSTNFVAGVSHPAHNGESGGSNFCEQHLLKVTMWHIACSWLIKKTANKSTIVPNLLT